MDDNCLTALTNALAEKFDLTTAKKLAGCIYVRAADEHQAYEMIGRLFCAEDLVQRQELFAEPWSTRWSSVLYRGDQERIAERFESGTPPVLKEGGIQCYQCGKKKTFFYQLQTRSGDEGMTTFYTCAHCFNRWKG